MSPDGAVLERSGLGATGEVGEGVCERGGGVWEVGGGVGVVVRLDEDRDATTRSCEFSSITLSSWREEETGR